MATRPNRKRLGRGLSSLITSTTTTDDSGHKRERLTAPLASIFPMRGQPRSEFDTSRLEELADSIRANGIIQPLVVRADEDNRFVLIAGERRWRAAQMAGLDEVPVVVREVSDTEAFEMALVENIQREDLNPIEEAEAFARLIDECAYTQDELAKRVGKSRVSVTNALRLLKLADPIQGLVAEGVLSSGHARAVLSVPDKKQSAFAERVVTDKLSVRQAEALGRRWKSGETEPAPKTDTPAPRTPKHQPLRPQLRRVQLQLMERFGTRVELRQKEDGSGLVELHFADNDGLQAILDVVFED